MDERDQLTERELKALEAENSGSWDRRRWSIFDRLWDGMLLRLGILPDEETKY